jgi:MoxR-like ATPase
MEGTYPLPEAQLDRFLLKVRLDYPDEAELVRIVSATTGPEAPSVTPLFHPDEAASRIEALKRLVREVMVTPGVEKFVARMVRATQPSGAAFMGGKKGSAPSDVVDRYVAFGSSPRGAQALTMGAKVVALLDGRANVSFEDVERVAPAALPHRIALNYAAHSDGIDANQIIEGVFRSVRAARG